MKKCFVSEDYDVAEKLTAAATTTYMPAYLTTSSSNWFFREVSMWTGLSSVARLNCIAIFCSQPGKTVINEPCLLWYLILSLYAM